MPIKMRQVDTVVLFQSTGCRESENEINSLEYVQVVLTIEAPVRGAIELYLQSPSGWLNFICKFRTFIIHWNFLNRNHLNVTFQKTA